MNETLRQPPSSLEAEQAVIGALLLGAKFDEISSIIESADFFHPNHSVIFSVVGNVIARGSKADLITVSDALEARKELNNIGGIAYLADMAKNTPSVTNAENYARVIKDKATQRKLLAIAREITSTVYGDSPTDEKIAVAQNLALSVDSAKGKEETVDINSALQTFIDEIDDRRQNKKHGGIETGMVDYDKLVKGLKNGHVHVIAGRPGSGKTAFALNIIKNVILQNNPVLMFSLEMPTNELIQRMVSNTGGISLDALDDGNMEPHHWDKLSASVASLRDRPLQTCDIGGLTINRIRTIARFQKKIHGTKLIVIDYIGLIRTPAAKGANRNQELGEVSRQVKEMAKELDLPVIELAQLNRSIETRSDKTPTLSDLRDSGEIEQDADTVTFIYRGQNEENGITEITVAKNRHGKTGRFEMRLNGQFSRFEPTGSNYSQSSDSGKKSWADKY
jgi:replicative DNA helicase